MIDLTPMVKAGKSAIHCDTREQAMEFFEELRKIAPHKLRSATSEVTITQAAFSKYSPKDIAFCPHFGERDRAGFCNVDYYRDKGYVIFNYHELAVDADLGPIDAGEFSLESLF